MVQVPNGAEIKLYFSVGGQLAVNTFGARVVSPATVIGQSTADALGSAIKAAFTAQVAVQMATTTQLVRVGVRDLRQNNMTEFRDTGAAVAGTAPTSDGLPASVAQCVTLRTAGAGKSFRGRVFLSGWAEAANGPNGTQIAGAATAGVNFVGAVSTALVNNGMQMAVLTRPQKDVVIQRITTETDGTERTDVLSHQTAKPGATHDLTSLESRTSNWESQRRRTNGRGVSPSMMQAVAAIRLSSSGVPLAEAAPPTS